MLHADSYGTEGRLQMPQAQHIMEYLVTLSLDDIRQDFSVLERQKIVFFCLSFTRFHSQGLKNKAMELSVIISDDLEDVLLSARVSLRKRELLRIFPDLQFDGIGDDKEDLTSDDAASNAFLGEKMLLEVQGLIDRDKLTLAWSKLGAWQPLVPERPSILEASVDKRRDLFKAITCRFSGQFVAARNLLVTLLDCPSGSVAPYAFSHLVAVYCELNQISDAKFLLDLEQRDKRYPSWAGRGKGRRLDVAAAGVHLMEGLWAMKSQSLTEAQSCLNLAKVRYQELREIYQSLSNPGLGASVNYFSVLAGLAVTDHLQCKLQVDPMDDQQLEAILSSWGSAWSLAEKCRLKFGWDPSFTQTIILYARSHIKLKQGKVAEMFALFKEARDGYWRTGRQTYWTGLGTLFFFILEDMNEHDGGMRICPRQEYEPHSETPSENRYQFTLERRI
jgi:hypothetical protein